MEREGSGERLPVGAHPDEMLLGTLAGVSLRPTSLAYCIREP
jgi:hypothetical protein